MPNDTITLSALNKELSLLLSGGRVEKIYQPESDEIAIWVKNNGIQQLVISANSARPRAHISSQKKENALTAPTFCMLLRKYLVGATINNMEIFNSDRIIKITFDGRSELKDKVQYFIFAELMGRYSNIILTKADMTIIDALKRVHFDQNTSRPILPNLPYPIQPKDKISLSDDSLLKNFFDNNKAVDRDTLLKNISGIAKETANEIAASNNPYQMLLTLCDIHGKDIYRPCLLYKNGKIIDFFVMPYTSLSGDYVFFDSLNQAVDKYYCHFDGQERKNNNAKKVKTLLKRLQQKTVRRIADYTQKLEETAKMDKYKQMGDLILSNIYLIVSRAKELECYDYYNDKQISIPLDSALTPSQNAQVYYKKYNKLKRAEEVANSQLETLHSQHNYLKSIEVAIENSDQKQEFEEIFEELQALGGLKKQKSVKKSKIKPSLPRHIKYKDCDIFWGKNNMQNNEVTFKIADNKDMWFHTKNSHGAHVIVKGIMEQDVILKGAQIAAYYSEVRSAERVEVDYCLKKYVKKIPSAMMGMVTYSNQKTLLVQPKNESE